MALAKPCAAEAGPRLRAARRNRGPGSAKRHEECRIAPGTRDSLVIAGLDPVIHPLRKTLAKRDGYAGPGYAKASPGTPVSGRRSFSEDGKPAYDAECGAAPRVKFLFKFSNSHDFAFSRRNASELCQSL